MKDSIVVENTKYFLVPAKLSEISQPMCYGCAANHNRSLCKKLSHFCTQERDFILVEEEQTEN